jgi:short-subunit dehydrogenase
MKILITGASSGIGRALATKLTEQGHLVWGVARNREKLAELQNTIGPDRFFWSVCDVSVREQITGALAEMEKNNFLPDAVVLNAAIFPKDTEPEFKKDAFDEAFTVNFYGAVNFIDALLPKFIARGSGQFLAVSSTSAFRPSPRGVAYSATKAALALAMRGFDVAYRKKGVAFKTVYLGPIATEMWEGKKNFLVASPEATAAFLCRALEREKRESYFPFLSTTIFRLVSFIPDNLFFKLSGIFFKK